MNEDIMFRDRIGASRFWIGSIKRRILLANANGLGSADVFFCFSGFERLLIDLQ